MYVGKLRHLHFSAPNFISCNSFPSHGIIIQCSYTNISVLYTLAQLLVIYMMVYIDDSSVIASNAVAKHCFVFCCGVLTHIPPIMVDASTGTWAI